MTKKAIILLSGGLDSATCLAIAQQQGYQCYALSFSYGQRHSAELNAAHQLALQAEVQAHRVIPIDLAGFGGSALTDEQIDVPTDPSGELTDGIPVTYVPARNTVFLSIALAWAEVIAADAIIAGVNAVDYSGYPDCRPEYIEAFQAMANLATKAGVEGQGPQILTPLIDKTKVEIIEWGTRLGVDYSQTVSCYQADQQGQACGQCDSCHIRRKAFVDAAVMDPTRYQQ